jgi:isopropylmalate/homocitrate/citramalate synthase
MQEGPTSAARHPEVLVTDVTLREHGQNVPTSELARFTPSSRAEFALALRDAGFVRIELLSCVSPKVAPAMGLEQLAAVVRALGRLDGVEVVTLVPNVRGYEAFRQLGLGSDGLQHTVGLFHSAVEQHNLVNLRVSIDESVRGMREVARRALSDGTPVSAYVAAAFGYREAGRTFRVSHRELADRVRRCFDMGARLVTLSDLQGLADEQETRRLWERVLALDGGAYASRLGYHAHHVEPQRAVDLVEAAFRAGVRCFDTSLLATGGCVTGAPGNAPTQGVLERFHQLHAHTGVDERAVAALTHPWG